MPKVSGMRTPIFWCSKDDLLLSNNLFMLHCSKRNGGILKILYKVLIVCVLVLVANLHESTKMDTKSTLDGW